MCKFTVFYKLDGQTWSIEVEKPSVNMFDYMSQEDYDKLPDNTYYLETEKGLIKCDKHKMLLLNTTI